MYQAAKIDALVLICILPTQADFERVKEERWYRIPVARAPRQLIAEYLAFYLPAIFGTDRWAIRYIAAIQAVGIATRAELIPSEPDHIRAAERYYRYTLGPLESLHVPIPSQRFRRVSFIPTTIGQLLCVTDLNQLWQASSSSDPSDLWGAGIGRRAIRF